jgi:ABC-type transporter Mla maintaining outer membrane lipid asymmetry permease subunit MlaE
MHIFSYHAHIVEFIAYVRAASVHYYKQLMNPRLLVKALDVRVVQPHVICISVISIIAFVAMVSGFVSLEDVFVLCI